MSVRIGVNPIVWSNDDLRSLGGETPLETCLDQARKAGYAGIELGHKFPRDAGTLRPLLDSYGLALVSGWYSARLLERSPEEEIEAMQGHLDLLTALGCEVMVFAETSRCVHTQVGTPLAGRPIMTEGEWARLCTGLDRVGQVLWEAGMRLAYHHHMGTVIQTEAEVDRLMAETGPAVGLLLDTGHLAYAGGDPLAAVRNHGGRVVHVHLKDVRREVVARATAEGWPFLYAVPEGVFTVPGDGQIDYPPVLQALKSAGYDGWLVVEAEQDPQKAPPLEYARRGFEFSLALAEAVGLIE